MVRSWFFKKAVLKPVISGLVLLLAVCCSDPIDWAEPEENIHFRDDTKTPVSRTGMSGSNASFITGDQIGVFETLTSRSNVLYNYATPNWTTTPMYWRNYSSQHTFYAYYPYNASNNALTVTMPTLAVQAISSVPDPLRDLLISDKSTTRISPVNFKFTHAFTLLKFNVTFASSLLSTLLSSKITVTGGNSVTSNTSPYGFFNKTSALSSLGYDLTNKQLLINTNTSTAFQQSLTATLPTLVSGSTTLYMLVLPGTYTNPAPYVKFSVQLISLIEISTSSPSLNLTTLQPNTVYEYNVQITSKLLRRGNVSDDSLEISITPVHNFSD